MADTSTNAQSTPPQGESRRDFLLYATTAVGVAGTAMAVWPFIHSMNPAADTLALSTTEVDLASVAEGQSITVTWRGKPVFIRHRTPAEIETATKDDGADLRDPQKDAARVKRPEWLILIVVCTHLGCVPTFGAGDYGGWFCPCHGSHYDTSGRIRKGPAPKNLVVPTYEYVSDTRVKIG